VSDTVSIIPDSDSLYYRIHKADCVNGEIVPGAFKPRNGAMSTDWSAMSTVEKCRSRATNVEKNGVVVLKYLKLEK
jgi:hypothetical protein